MKIYLVRHGETEANTQKKYLGSSHSPFTEKGLLDNEKNILKLSTVKIDAIYTSPCKRCLSVADTLAEKISIHPVPDNRLKELDFGIFENMSWQQAKNTYTDEFEKWCSNTYEYKIPDGESQAELDNRIALFVEELLHSRYNNIVVFSHAGPIMSIISKLLKLNPLQKWQFKISTGSMVQIEANDEFSYLLL